MAIWNTVSRVAKNISTKYKASKPKNLVSNVVPFGAGKGAVTKIISKTPSAIGKAWNTVKTFTTKKTINPLVGTKLKDIPKGLGKLAVIGGGVGGLYGLGKVVAKAGVSKNVPSIGEASSTIAQSAVVGAGLNINPVGGVVGAIEGAGKNVGQTATNFYNILRGKGQSLVGDVTNKFNDISQSLPTSPQSFTAGDTIINYTMPDMSSAFPSQPVNIFTPSTPSPSFNPSFSLGGVGGGIGENLPLIMLLLAGGGGYLLGKKKKKKKRKKKKYKKRKRR